MESLDLSLSWRLMCFDLSASFSLSPSRFGDLENWSHVPSAVQKMTNSELWIQKLCYNAKQILETKELTSKGFMR